MGGAPNYIATKVTSSKLSEIPDTLLSAIVSFMSEQKMSMQTPVYKENHIQISTMERYIYRTYQVVHSYELLTMQTQ